MTGPPVQVMPTAPEPGVPSFVVTPGTPNPFPTASINGSGSSSSSDTGFDGSGSDSSTGDGGTNGSSAGSSASSGDSTALGTMLSTPWGAAAVSTAEQMGVNPSALAATCVIESGCQNVTGSGTVAGAFQMTSSTFTAMINQAIAQNPGLASQIVPGIAGQMDPATQAAAAAQYLITAATALQNAGVSNPTVLDTRGFYNFGPSGTALATAGDDQLVSQVMPNVSQKTLAANGVTAGATTVGQWKASVSQKMGNAASQSVLT